MLQDLEAANAFVVSLDARRSWFRYHHLFADLLQLELRRTAPDEVTMLHRAASGWFAGHGYPVEATRHAQAARDWGLAARLLADHWHGLQLDGQAATIHELLVGFPAGTRTADAELAALMAADELMHGPRWRPPSGTWAGRSAEWRRYRMRGAPGRSCCWGSAAAVVPEVAVFGTGTRASPVLLRSCGRSRLGHRIGLLVAARGLAGC